MFQSNPAPAGSFAVTVAEPRPNSNQPVQVVNRADRRPKLIAGACECAFIMAMFMIIMTLLFICKDMSVTVNNIEKIVNAIASKNSTITS